MTQTANLCNLRHIKTLSWIIKNDLVVYWIVFLWQRPKANRTHFNRNCPFPCGSLPFFWIFLLNTCVFVAPAPARFLNCFAIKISWIPSKFYFTFQLLHCWKILIYEERNSPSGDFARPHVERLCIFPEAGWSIPTACESDCFYRPPGYGSQSATTSEHPAAGRRAQRP